MNKEWRVIPSWPDYEVSENGEIRTKADQTIKKQSIHLGRLRVSFSIKGQTINRTVHSLVAEAFIGPRPTGTPLHHKDGNSLNNHYTNLEYILTGKHYRNHQLTNPNFNTTKLTADSVKAIRNLRKQGLLYREIAELYGVSIVQIHKIIKGKDWKHVAE